MRFILDVSTDAGNHIEGTASWADGGSPIQFSGWLALMRLLEDASRDGGAGPATSADRPADLDAAGTEPDP